MAYSNYDKVLIQTFFSRYKLIVLVMAIVAITLIIEFIYLLKTKSNNGISIWSFLSQNPIFTQRLSLKQQIARDIIVIFILATYLCCNALPFYNDISRDQYIEVEAVYSRTERDAKGNLFSNGHIYIESNGETIRLELPDNWTYYEYPEGTFWATIWYSKDTKVVLSVETEP